MKIVVIGSHASSLVNFRGELLKAMVRQGHDVLACAPAVDEKTRETLDSYGVRVKEVSISRTGLNPIKDIGTVIELVCLLVSERPDKVLAYTAKPVIYGSIAARLADIEGMYSMITGLGSFFIPKKNFKHSMVALLVKNLYKLSLIGNRCVFFQNHDDVGEFKGSGLLRGQARTCLIKGSGVDTEYFAPAVLAAEPFFLLIARLIGEKGVKEYVDAAKIVLQIYNRGKFFLVGWLDSNPSAVTREELDSWVGEGLIEYLGKLDDVRPAIARCQVYVLPSYYREGTPRTVLEAMSMARPVITTDVPGCRETVIDGVNGFLVPARDSEELARAMKRFIELPRLAKRMGRASRRLAENKYNVHNVNKVIMKEMGLC